ncbi:hypothetical protein [Paenibacillus dendritiformis]|uniref:hypothetical protein n=1 Tax=Paenibacillus dendritiformis TaxID=130049 RepID=UPI00387E1B10
MVDNVVTSLETKRTNQSKILIGCAGAVGIIVLIGVIFVIMLLGFRSDAVSLQNRIEAQYIANKSNYDSMWKKFKEMTQVSELQAEQFKDVYKGLIEGRNKDTGLLFRMVQEQNPALSHEIYNNLQREIASSRNVFDNNQKKVVDIIREYNTRINTGTGFIFNAFFDFQPIDANKYIVTSDKTSNAFETNKDDVIDLKGK